MPGDDQVLFVDRQPADQPAAVGQRHRLVLRFVLQFEFACVFIQQEDINTFYRAYLLYLGNDIADQQ